MQNKRFNQWVKRTGGPTKAADLLRPHMKVGVYRQKVQGWLTSGVPPEAAVAVNHVAGIPKEKLCPDVFYEVA